MLAWLRNLWNRPAGQAPRKSSSPRRKAPAKDAVAQGPTKPARFPSFKPFAELLEVDEPAAPPVDAARDEEEAAIAAQVLAHFRENRPEASSFPSLALQILNLVARPKTEVSELASLVARDPAVSTGVLSVANSAFFRGSMEITTVRDAITRLGLVEVGRIAGAVSTRSLFDSKIRAEQNLFGDRWRVLFHQAISSAWGAASLGMRYREVRADRAYLGGLLHDVGKALALRSMAALVLRGTLPLPPDDPRIDRVIERIHVEVGAEAHEIWKLPKYLHEIALRHHEADLPGGEETAVLHAVRLASALIDLRGPFAPRAAAEILQSANALDFDPYVVRALDTDIRANAEKATALLGAK